MQETTVSPSTPMPKAYGFLPKGDRYKTLHCRKLTHKAGSPLYIVVDKNKQVSLHVPVELIFQVHAQARQTLSTRRAATSIRDANDIAKASAEIDMQFPEIPKKEKEAVVYHGFKKHSGRVGRTNSISLSEKVLLAVIARSRHKHTEYDALLRSGEQREVARKATREDVERVLQRWGRAKATKKAAKKAAKKKALPKKTKAEDFDDAEFVDD
jgi:hypothetical protein